MTRITRVALVGIVVGTILYLLRRGTEDPATHVDVETDS
jgi:hypothetical protein